MTAHLRRLLVVLAALALVATAAGCGSDDSAGSGGSERAGSDNDDSGDSGDSGAGGDDAGGGGKGVVRLLTHDSFTPSEGIFEAFTADTGYEVEIIPAGDAVAVVNQAILTAGDPEADVLFGVDNNLLTRVYDAELFDPYASPELDALDPDVQLDPEHRVTPVDRGDVCLNYDKEWFAAEDLEPPDDLGDLIDPAYEGLTVVQNPATSTPGLAFLLATVAAFGGESGDGWETYWSALVDADVAVGDGWEDTYYGRFSGGSGEGDRPIVVSYATSPVAEVVFADPRPDEAPTGVVDGSCYRQIEFAGVLRGASNPDGARALVDYLVSLPFQEDLPLTMFVFPVRTDADLPPEYDEHAVVPDEVLELPFDEVGAQRDGWIETWTEIVLG